MSRMQLRHLSTEYTHTYEDAIMGNTTSILPPEAQTSAQVQSSKRLRSNRSSLASRLAHAPPSPLFPSPTGNNSLLGLARFARHPVVHLHKTRGKMRYPPVQGASFSRSAGLHRLSHWRVGHSSFPKFSYMHSGARGRRDDWLQPPANPVEHSPVTEVSFFWHKARTRTGTEGPSSRR